jgi:PilZ domain
MKNTGGNLSDSTTTALVLCTDTESQATIEHVFGQHRISAHVALTSWAARKVMMEKEFDVLVVDFDEPEASEVVDSWCTRGPNASKVVMVLGTSSETLKLARQKHSHFVMQKPLNGLVMVRTLKIAFSVLMKKRRAEVRLVANLHALGIFQQANGPNKDVPLTLVDISQGGACVKSLGPLPVQKHLDLAFRLSLSGELIQLAGKVVWSEPNGFSGIRFTSVPTKAAKLLNAWVETNDATADSVVQVVPPQIQSQGHGRSPHRI